MTITKLVEVTRAKRQGTGYKGFCPAHEDRTPSLSITETTRGRVLVKCHAGCEQHDVLTALKAQGVSLNGANGRGDDAGRRKVAAYDYHDADGNEVFRVVRYQPKDFRQFRPDGRDGWIPGTQGVRRVPYRLPELIAAVSADRPVYIVEGEKDCEALRKLGLVATTNAGGAGKWHDEFSEYLRGADVVILPDNDEPGRDHAQAVAQSVSRSARRVRVIELPGLPEKGDVSDWLLSSGNAVALFDLAAHTADWVPERAAPSRPSSGPLVSRNEPWAAAAVPDGFELGNDGVFRVSETATQRTKICGPLWVEAKTRDAVTGTFGFVVRWRDLDGKVSEPRAFRNDVLMNERGDFLHLLSALGLHVMPSQSKPVRSYLSGFLDKPMTDMRSTSKAGWLDQSDGRLIFVLPHETIGTRDGEQIVFQPERMSPAQDALTARGSLTEWVEHVGKLCERNPVLVMGVCLALAAPLLKPAGVESGGLHWYGKTTRGKTTSLRVIASAFGSGENPNTGHSAVQCWNTTANALEALAAVYNDLLLPLDEIDECEAADFGTVIFRLIGGRGRARLDKASDLMPVRTWRNLVISTGEIPAWQKIEQDRRTARGGQKTRLADVPVAEHIFVELHGRSSARELADELQRYCSRYFGTLVPTFIRRVIEEFENEPSLRRHLHDALDKEVKRLSPAFVSPEQSRVIRRIALATVAGNLAHELRVLPWIPEMIANSATFLVGLYLTDSASVPDHVRGVIAVRDCVQRDRARFRDLAAEITPLKLLGYITPKVLAKPALVLFTQDGFAEATRGHNQQDVLAELRQRALLFQNESDRFLSRHDIDGVRPRFYAVYLDRLLELDVRPGATDEKSDGTDGTSGTLF